MTRKTRPWYVNSGVLHRDGEVPAATSLPPPLAFPWLASSGDGLAGSMREGGVFEDAVNLLSRVSRE